MSTADAASRRLPADSVRSSSVSHYAVRRTWWSTCAFTADSVALNAALEFLADRRGQRFDSGHPPTTLHGERRRDAGSSLAAALQPGPPRPLRDRTPERELNKPLSPTAAPRNRLRVGHATPTSATATKIEIKYLRRGDTARRGRSTWRRLRCRRHGLQLRGYLADLSQQLRWNRPRPTSTPHRSPRTAGVPTAEGLRRACRRALKATWRYRRPGVCVRRAGADAGGSMSKRGWSRWFNP